MTLHRITTKALLRSLPPVHSKCWPWRQKERLLAALDAGGIVTRYELIDAMWGDDPEGGPDDANATMQVHIQRLRRRGYPIRNHHGNGYSLGGHELQRNLAAGD